jgi:hypothetical protein
MLTHSPTSDVRRPTTVGYHLGTPLVLTNETGEIVAEWKRDPFGQVIWKSGSVNDHHLFPGQFEDYDTFLVYNWNPFGRRTAAIGHR